MTKGQAFVAVCAGAFLVFLVNIGANMLIGFGARNCIVTESHQFFSPNRRYTLEQSMSQCDSEPETVALYLYDPDDPRSRTTLIQTVARITNADGRTYDPVGFGIRWIGNSELEIEYPHGLRQYSSDRNGGHEKQIEVGKSERYGLQYSAMPSAL
jgi:hypothetical protein